MFAGHMDSNSVENAGYNEQELDAEMYPVSKIVSEQQTCEPRRNAKCERHEN